ncbi:MAG: YihY family inner membrane protein [Campylobacteraceae bacterium]|jgi:membrane protein|nr:YihY family inner membrane protein [Campylobacteraceae bacterium]
MSKIVQACKDIWKLILRINDKDLMTYSSSLSFHTILSVIPVLLLTFSVVTKLPSFEKHYNTIKIFIFNSLSPSNPSVISEYIDKFLGNTTQIGIFGFVSMLVVSVLFFRDYEGIFNKIMHAAPRSFWQSLSSYWTLVTLAPILLGVSFYLSGAMQDFLDSYGLDYINILEIFPYLVVWTLFFTIYMISSGAKIYFRAGALSSFLASFIWYISKTLFVLYATHNQIYQTIYGPFSVALFLFVWVYISWVIFLYGAKICYLLNSAYQKKKETAAKERQRQHKNTASHRAKRKSDINQEQP